MKNNLKMRVLFTVLLLVVSGILVSAQVKPGKNGSVAVAGDWRVLGSRTAGHSADHDAIEVNGPHDYYRKLKFKVTNSPLNMQKMVVRYDDGAPENIDVRSNIPQGGESRIIDLKGGKRKLKSVEFWYDTKGILNGKADLTLFGMK
jgi:hypothetical protein